MMEFVGFYSTTSLHENESFNLLKVIRKSKIENIKKGDLKSNSQYKLIKMVDFLLFQCLPRPPQKKCLHTNN